MSLTQLDNSLIWHPFTQMALEPFAIPIVAGKDALLETESGEFIIDAISSWWVNVHGHAHPKIACAIATQAAKLEQVIFAGFTHPPAIALASKITQKLPGPLKKVFFSDNGSTAVEVALKMAIQFNTNKSQKKCRLIAFENAYHGDTFGAMSVGASGTFTLPYRDFLFDVARIRAPYPGCEEAAHQDLQREIEAGGAIALIYEPLVQGAAGMLMHNPIGLSNLLETAKKSGLILIADEVMTGFGRTGTLFASEQLTTTPDIICLSKGLTGGFLPLGLTVCAEQIYEGFLSEDRSKMFFHSHSFTANPISCAAALASIGIFEEQDTWENISRIQSSHEQFVHEMQFHSRFVNPRQCGTICALDLIGGEATSYLNPLRDQIYQLALENGVLLRPLGNVLYCMPPYCTQEVQLERIYATIRKIAEKI
ncbi:MAG: adenosylmethionine--8-amino-7-oxononanoate transaminase [Bdellovibrionales bacterium]|nr:adenosylmethionine--8-amino-7-oxononanoate transaminase [Bdellovibrionales bacterium]